MNTTTASSDSCKRSEKFMEWHKSAFPHIIHWFCLRAMAILLLLFAVTLIVSDVARKIQFGDDTNSVYVVVIV